MIVVGEASGDSHGAKLVDALKEIRGESTFEFFGATGSKLRKAGVETIVAADQFGIMGVPEVAQALPMFWRAFKTLKREAQIRQPDAVVLIDFPEFNLKLAKSLKQLGFKVIFYVSPQIWAWRKYRIRAIEKYVDLLLSILPFEKDWYASHGIRHVEYVGNPIVGEIRPAFSKDEFCEKNGLDPKRPIIAILAGSRRKEVARILPVLIETASSMAYLNPELQFVNALASTRKMNEVEAVVNQLVSRGITIPDAFVTVQDETYDALNAADAAAVTSGTATMETAVIGTPMAIVYKTSALNWMIHRPLISVEHFGLVNLIAQERVVKELIQNDLTVDRLSRELFRLLDSAENKQMRKILASVCQKLGSAGTSARAAAAVLRMID